MAQFILFAPLLGAIIAGFGWRVIGEKAAQYLTTGILFAACFFSWIIFLGFDGEVRHLPVMDWIVSGDFTSEWAIRLDRLTAIMLIVVTSVSALVHMYSMGYMAHDDNFTHDEHYKARFFAYLSFFTFAMLMLVTADNLLQMFFGWEGVGVASYLLIGFYFKKQSAGAAAMKAFIVNRVGDFGFLLGIFGLYWMTGAIQFDTVFGQVPELAQTQMHFLWRDWNAAEVLAVLLFIGAMGKSAQLLLHTWLPDAMEGPTPVSALIHAATMVTAGVFLVCRMSPLYEFAPDAKTFITVIGATTAFFAATVGLVQNDIKRVIAYSTCSQLGYMFVAAGVGVYSVAMFHLLTHAFFKAMLFLGAGSVIHAMHHEQDMRNYGGLRKKIPLTFWAMLIGTLAITGVGIPLTHIGFAGFLSKDAVIESAWAGNTYAFWMLVIAAAFTSFYSWRLMFMTFWGKPRGDQHAHDHAHESPRVMTIPLGVLAIGAIFAGMVWYGPFFGSHDKLTQFFHMGHGEAHATQEHGEAEHDAHAIAEPAGDEEHAAADIPAPVGGAVYMHPDNHVLDEAHHAPTWVKVSPFIAMVLGFLLAWIFYIRSPEAPAKLAAQQPALYQFLLNKWYFDELYDVIFVRPARWLGRTLWTGGDGAVIDGAINGVAMGIIPRLTRFAGRVQTGYLFHYAFAMVLGIVGLLIWVMMRGTH
ncbi:NADH-quinone oxidoreductase subunit L [Paracoccus seriniphilus]|uniref:NADH dehydrogenase subunit L n=1 Tax=Paracoccus seriniphilus TaxID=184748 RepID=A0A239PN23_9RHOB|nr:NADH-quinone oxidoreductase subunit L [Paracoccus seriniphilus]WCR14876.1 NADH-quinone oxidoreductase subunit L [Paracoccus seriniphilus]SNT71705.1 NADH dehydrogenase subunit L [Paracoccus seriniphilus]